MFKSQKPVQKTTNEDLKFSFFSSFFGFFTLNQRLSVAHADLGNSAQHRSELIHHMEEKINLGQNTNKLTKERIESADNLIQESQSIRKNL